MKDFFDNQKLLQLIWKWKIHLIIVGVIAVLASTIFSSSLFITPLFKSEARIYPINTGPYSEESESEQMTEIFNSNDIKFKLIDSFDLDVRYKISRDDPKYKAYILLEYNDHVEAKKTEYESIRLRVLDAVPQIASDMVDSLIVFYNQKIKESRMQDYLNRVETLEGDLERKLSDLDTVTNRMENMRKTYGFLDYAIQTEQLTRGLGEAIARGASKESINQIQQKLDLLAQKGGDFRRNQSLMRALEIERDTISRRLERAMSHLHKNETYTLVVEKPYPADKKSYPTRWLIVLVSFISLELLALIVLYLFEGSLKPKS